jgi:hypothetical protein
VAVAARARLDEVPRPPGANDRVVDATRERQQHGRLHRGLHRRRLAPHAGDAREDEALVKAGVQATLAGITALPTAALRTAAPR